MKTMKFLSQYHFFLMILLLICVEVSSAQYRSTEPSLYRNTGNIIKVEQNQPTGALNNFFNMKMSHSYEASFMSFGGQTSNLNMYTNSMFFTFSPQFTGQVDVAVAHSPFGSGFPGMNQNSPQFFIRNAQLNYKFSENTQISFSYQELPFGATGFGMQNNRFNSNFWMWN